MKSLGGYSYLAARVTLQKQPFSAPYPVLVPTWLRAKTSLLRICLLSPYRILGTLLC